MTRSISCLPADDGVQLALPGPPGQVDAVVIQKLALFLGLAALGLPALAGVGLAGAVSAGGLTAAEEAVQEREGGGLAVSSSSSSPSSSGRSLHLLRAAEGLHHLAVEVLQILRR